MKKSILTTVVSITLMTVCLNAQQPYRNGTTAANFLEVGIGGAAAAMGDAYVAATRDISGAYWNPSGLAFITGSESCVAYQPWIADIDVAHVSTALNIPGVGTVALAMTNMNYGEIEVNTMLMQEGTGELYTANEYAVNLLYARKLADWFAFGAGLKFISSSIMHVSASAAAVDLGVTVQTNFFRFGGDRNRGMNIGMSISNYGTRFQYDGIDLLNPIDIAPNEEGNYEYVPGQYRMESWELPLIFRIGIALHPIQNRFNEFLIAVDALHPNNAAESVNVGAEYQLKFPGTGAFYMRGGWKSLIKPDIMLEDGITPIPDEFGLTYGVGIKILMVNNASMQFDYSYRTVGMLGNSPSYTFRIVL